MTRIVAGTAVGGSLFHRVTARPCRTAHAKALLFSTLEAIRGPLVGRRAS